MAVTLRPIGELATPEAINAAVISTADDRAGAEEARAAVELAIEGIPSPEAINLQVSTRLDQLPPIPENAGDIGAEPVGLSVATKDGLTATFVPVLVYASGAYPARPTGAASAKYIGPVQPTNWLANDEWVDNS